MTLLNNTVASFGFSWDCRNNNRHIIIIIIVIAVILPGLQNTLQQSIIIARG